jgi:protein-S-isoprenylcysteine O-methyltransferase Ste14
LLPFSEPLAFVTAGPFEFTRNPMYLGMLLSLVGWLLRLGSLVPTMVIPCFFALIHYRFVLREEPFMAEHFGDAYAAYRARVRRWL